MAGRVGRWALALMCVLLAAAVVATLADSPGCASDASGGSAPLTQASPASREDAADAELGEQAVSLRDSYGARELALIDALGGGVWVGDRPDLTATFSNRAFTVNDAGQTSTTAYVVTAVATDGTRQSGETLTAFSAQLPGSTQIGRLTRRIEQDGHEAATLVFAALGPSATWTLEQAPRELSVDAPDEGWCAAAGTTQDALCDAVASAVARSMPQAARATWTATAAFDYAAGTARVEFELEGARKRAIARVDMVSGEVSAWLE